MYRKITIQTDVVNRLDSYFPKLSRGEKINKLLDHADLCNAFVGGNWSQITSTIPHIFENNLIIALDIEWISKFGKLPTFSAYIDDSQKLHLISQEVIQK